MVKQGNNHLPCVCRELLWLQCADTKEGEATLGAEDQARSWCGDQVQDPDSLSQDSGNTDKNTVRRHEGNRSRGPGTE